MKTKQCLICKKNFQTKFTNLYCSDLCRKKNRSSQNKKYHLKNKASVNQKARERYTNNKEWFQKRDKKRHEEQIKKRIDSGEIIIRRTKFDNLSEDEKKAALEEINKKKNDKRRLAYQDDILLSLKTRIRSLINKRIRENNFTKSGTTAKYLGCSIEEFFKHIEQNFKVGMSWSNREKWHIDHIIPISLAKNEDDFIRLSHYSNLQPMWADENIKKSNKIGFDANDGVLLKKFKPNSDFQLIKYEKPVTFVCKSCGNQKKSKSIVIEGDEWSKVMCNGCYGKLLSERT